MSGSGQNGSWRHTQGKCKETCADGCADVTESCTDLGEAFGKRGMFSIAAERKARKKVIKRIFIIAVDLGPFYVQFNI